MSLNLRRHGLMAAVLAGAVVGACSEWGKDKGRTGADAVKDVGQVVATKGASGEEIVLSYRAGETKAQRDARLKWWREARFGMFIHWGIYSVPGGTYKGQKEYHIGEWIMRDKNIPVAEYAEYAKQFNPVKFNAEEWVLLAKNAGMKYMVITSKHHDGFAMFHSRTSPYNIYDATPFKRDPLKELAAACKKHGMKLGFYYSQAQDWHHPGGAAAKGPYAPKAAHWDPAQDGDMDAYIRNIAVPQVREILTNYGPVAELWWDTPQDMTPERAKPLLELVKLQPKVVMNDRLIRFSGESPVGDIATPEQYVPATGIPGKDWETCMTMNDTWGYKPWDENWKSTQTLIRNLVDASSKGGNYLLNVGPSPEGVIPPASQERLKQMGEWLNVNGESVYATTASPFKLQKWGKCTKKVEGDKVTLYLHVFQWPADGKIVVPVRNTVTKCYLLSDKSQKPIAAYDADAGKVVQLAGSAPDANDSVVVMETVGTPDVVKQWVQPGEGGEIVLEPQDVSNLKVARYADISQLGKVPAVLNRWDKGGEAAWEAHVPPGKYDVMVNASLSEDAHLKLTIEPDSADLTVKSTGVAASQPVGQPRVFKFETTKAGEITVSKGGDTAVKVTMSEAGTASAMSIHEVQLKPAK